MTPTTTQKVLIIIIIFGIAGYFLYKTFFSNIGNVSLVEPISTTSDSAGQDILDSLDKLNTIKIDPTLFSSQLFQNLKDESAPLSPEAQGRNNPFMTVGIDTGTPVTPVLPPPTAQTKGTTTKSSTSL